MDCARGLFTATTITLSHRQTIRPSSSRVLSVSSTLALSFALTTPSLPRYDRPAIGLHWLSAVAIIATFAIGWIVADLPFSPRRLRLLSYHKWLGVTVFLLTVARLAWRVAHPPPPAPPTMPTWQRHAAGWTHRALYALLLAIPLSGWVYSSAKGLPVVFLGLVQLPDLVDADRALAATLSEVHRALVYSLAALVGLHVLAAGKHALIARDGLLRRMLPTIALACLLLPMAALAQQRVVPEKSEIRFTSRQMGVPVDGRFTRFSVDAQFDPASPAASRASVDVDLASVSLIDAEAQKELARPGWFDSAKFPIARFQSSSIRALGGNRFEALGRITLKGLARDITMTMTARQEGGQTIVEGQFTLRRLDFKIGDGEWSDPSIVANDVLVRVRITLAGK